MFQPKSFQHLCNAMQTGAAVDMGKGNVGIIQSIEREDGSGFNWNVTIRITNTGLGSFAKYPIDTLNKIFFREIKRF